MWPIGTDVTRLSVCLYVGHMDVPAKIAEPIEMLLSVCLRWAQRIIY